MLMKILFALIALTVIVPVALYYKSGKTKGKECLLMNAISFFSILGVGVICTLGGGVSALAAGTGAFLRRRWYRRCISCIGCYRCNE